MTDLTTLGILLPEELLAVNLILKEKHVLQEKKYKILYHNWQPLLVGRRL